MQVSAYVDSKIKDTAVAGSLSRVFNNLAVAGILPTTTLTASSKSAVDNLLAKLERKLAGKQVVARKPEVTDEAQRTSLSNAASLRKCIDPATGEALSRIKLLGGIEALHNPNTRVVYPIPTGSVPAFV